MLEAQLLLHNRRNKIVFEMYGGHPSTIHITNVDGI
jgi:hypothetical protein